MCEEGRRSGSTRGTSGGDSEGARVAREGALRRKTRSVNNAERTAEKTTTGNRHQQGSHARGERSEGKTGRDGVIKKHNVRGGNATTGGRAFDNSRMTSRSSARVIWRALGIAAATAMTPRTFAAWIDADARVESAGRKARRTCAKQMQEWAVPIKMGNANQVVCMTRAARRIKGWRTRGGKKNAHRELAQYLVDGVVHKDILPTAQTGNADRYYLPGLQRHMNADEMCSAFGIEADSPLRKALCGTTRVVADIKAISMLGAAVEVKTMRKVLRASMARAGIRVGEEKVRMMDVCSGVSTVAEAMAQETQGNWQYVAAAEKDTAKRRVLLAAWGGVNGLSEATVWHDATEMEGAPECDVYVMTPDCGRYSRLSQTDQAEALEATGMVRTLMRYATAKRPRVVVLESVADLLTSTRMRMCGEAIERHLQDALPDYEWSKQAVDASTHGGVPMRRDRAMWVGVRPPESS